MLCDFFKKIFVIFSCNFFFRNLQAEGKYSRHVIAELKKPESEEIDLELILSLIKYICRNEREGAILVFLPGWDKIVGLHKLMLDHSYFRSSKPIIVIIKSRCTFIDLLFCCLFVCRSCSLFFLNLC